jgi:CheY-like chemotaxis protein
VLAASLEAGGFNTWTATDGFKAFDTFLRHTGEIDLVLIGSDLPDVPAAALARRIRVNFPGIPCAFFAGSRNPDCDDALRRLGAEPVPLAFPELLEALHELAATDTGVPS